LFPTAGAGKKKWLTDPVDIIPFPNQNLRDKVAATPKPIAPSVRQVTVIDQKPEPKVAAVPTGQLNTAHLSIKKMMEKSEEEGSASDRSIENMPREPFSYDHVKMLWRRFAFEMKERGMETFYNAMIKREPIQKEDTEFMMDVDNQIQVDYITPHLQDLLAYFRKELKNYSFDVTIRITDNTDEEVKFLTGKDKFAALARKNPNLHTLKNTFNLDIEF
jgi:hypothetical protein